MSVGFDLSRGDLSVLVALRRAGRAVTAGEISQYYLGTVVRAAERDKALERLVDRGLVLVEDRPWPGAREFRTFCLADATKGGEP